MRFVPLTKSDRRFHDLVKQSAVGRLRGAWHMGSDDGELQVAITYGTHLKEARVAGMALEYLLTTIDLLLPGVGLLLVCSFPEGVDLAFQSDDRDDWKQYRAYPGGPDGNRLPQDLAGASGNYVCDRVAAIRECFLRQNVKYLLDLHATDGPSSPGYLGCAGPHAEHMKLLPYIGVGHYFTDVGKVQLEQGTKTYTFSAASGAEIGSEIEVGQTGTESALRNCLQLVQQWGRAVGAFRGRRRKTERKQDGYQMVASYMAPSGDYEVVDARLLADLAPVQAGEPILVNRTTGDEIRATGDQLLTWGPGDVKLAPEDLPTEIFFGCVLL